MRVLPVSVLNCSTKTNNKKFCCQTNVSQQSVSDVFTPSFKGSGAGAATVFGLVFGGAAALLAAPVALIAGAALFGAANGLVMSGDDEPLNDVERYKYTHEY